MKQVILSLFFLATVFFVQAQSKLVFEESKPESYLIKYAPATTASQTNINLIVSLLGKADEKKGVGRPLRIPEFVIRFEQQARIADAGDKLQVLVQLSKFTTSTDFYYKGFEVADVLKPEKVSAKIKLVSAKNKVVQVFDPQNVALNKNKVTLLETTVPDSAADQNYRLKVENIELIFTNEDVRKVQAYLDMVHEYYAAEVVVNLAMKELFRIEPEDIERLTQHDRDLRELEASYGKLKKASFIENLNLEKRDPQGLLVKMNRLERLLQDRRRALNHVLATLDQQFYNRAVDFALAGNFQAAQNFLVKSLEVNPNFAPAHLQLAKLDFRNGYITEATDRTHHLLTKMRVDPDTRQQAMVLAHDIYSTYITQGNNHTTRGEYRNALTAYGEARMLCSTIGGLHCNLPALNDGESRAAYGAYRALVSDGKRYMAKNDFAKADRLADEALQFQQQYDFVLHGATEAADLQNQVKYHYYVKHIDTGKQYLNDKNYAAALNQFEAALDIEKGYTFQRVHELVALAQKAAKPVMLQELQAGYDEARNNQLAQARQTASRVVAMQARFGLNQDKDIQSSYNLLRGRISTQECVNVQTIYDTHFQKAKDLASSKNYLAADKAYKAAIDAADGNAACHIATFTAQDGRDAILPAVTYQRMLADIDRFVASSRYTEAIEHYLTAEKHYVAYQVNRFGLDHISLYNYAKNNRKQPFTASVVQYLADQGEDKIALDLLRSLLDNGYAKRKTKKMQDQLGRQLAYRDAQLDLKEDPKIHASIYVNCNRKLNRLGNTYVKERKKLTKS